MRKFGNQRMRKWGNGEVTFWNINFAKISNFGKVRTAKAMCQGCQECSKGNGEVRKREGRGFGEKRVLDGWGVAYRELIGSLYESWTIGIGRVYKQLIYTAIQQG